MLGNIDANSGDPQTGNIGLQLLALLLALLLAVINCLDDNLESNFYNTAGWDTDQFPMDVAEATLVMLSVIKNVCLKIRSLQFSGFCVKR